MKGRWISYSEEELHWIEMNKLRMRKEAHAEFVELFGRADVSFSNYNALCKRKGWTTGRTGRFEKGAAPANKGKKGICAPGSEKGWFRKGRLPHNTKFLGHERVSKDGYVEISIDEPNPHTGYERRYVLKHRWEWEQKNGPLPDGMCLKCLDGDKTNTDPGNWEAIPRAMLPRLSGRYGRGFEEAEPEIRPTILAVTKLEYAVKDLKNKDRGQG